MKGLHRWVITGIAWQRTRRRIQVLWGLEGPDAGVYSRRTSRILRLKVPRIPKA